MMRSILLLILLLGFCFPHTVIAQVHGDRSNQSPGRDVSQAGDQVPEPNIIVTGRSLRGRVDTDVPPIAEIDDSQIAALASATIAELLQLLSGISDSGGTPPVVLVNGTRIASLSSIQSFPPEALRRIEILPEELAVRFGFPGDRKVVNLILRENFRAVSGEARIGASTDGGRGTYRGDIGVSRIASDQRWNLTVNLQRRDPLFEAQRGARSSDGRFRTLLARDERASLNGSWSGPIAEGTAFDLSATVSTANSSARSGRVNSFPQRSSEVNSRSQSGNLTASANGTFGEWSWFSKGSIGRSENNTRFDDLEDGLIRIDSARDRQDLFEAQLSLSGPLGSLPAGTPYTDVELAGSYERVLSQSTLSDTGRLSADRGNARFNLGLSLPLLGAGFPDGLGRLSGELGYGAGILSDFSMLETMNAGLVWQPAQEVRFRVAWSDEGRAPSLTELASATTRETDVLVYDFATANTVLLERIEGANPALEAQSERTFRTTLSLAPFLVEDLRFEARYVRARTRRPIGSVTEPSQQLENAFPERFERDASGQLIRFDATPVNFHRRERNNLSFSLNFTRTILAPLTVENAGLEKLERDARRARSAAFLFDLTYDLALRDRLQPFAEGPFIDYLNDGVGTRSRHQLRGSASGRRNGIGATIEGDWASRRSVRGSAPADETRGQLNYPALARFNLKMFADLGQLLSSEPRNRWAEGLRVVAEVDNVFNARRRITDNFGETPVALLPVFLDPEGRSIRLRIRKLF